MAPAASCDPVSPSPAFAQVLELQNKLSEESKKADKMEFEYKRLKEKVDSLQKEKDVRSAGRLDLTGFDLSGQSCCSLLSAANEDGAGLPEGDHRGAALCPGPGRPAHIRYPSAPLLSRSHDLALTALHFQAWLPG